MEFEKQVQKWAKQGYTVHLTVNDGHQDDIGKPSYCLWVSGDSGEFDLGDNDVHASLDEAVKAILAAPYVQWELEDVKLEPEGESSG